MAYQQGSPLDFLGVFLNSQGRPAGVLADTFAFTNGKLIMVDPNGLYWQLTIVPESDGTATIQIQQVTF